MSQHLEFILLHIIILYENSAGSNNCPTRFSEPGRILTGHVIYTLQRQTFESCTFSCELEWQCHSVNYFLLHKTCELNNATREGFPEDIVEQSGVFHVSVVIHFHDPCTSMRCENGGKCISNPSLRCQCLDGFSGPRCKSLKSLGMETGIIPDNDIVATSSKPGHEARKSRLNGPSRWMPVNNRETETITVKFKHWVRIIAIATQGSPNDGCWVKSYFIKYGVLNVSGSLPKEYQANFDKETVVTNQLSAPLLVDWIKIRPAKWSSCIALRVELYGY